MTRSHVFCALAGALAVVAFSSFVRAEPEPSGDDPRGFPILRDDGRPSQERDALVLVVEGLEGIIRPASLRVQLSGVFGRPVVSLSDPEAESARATLWIAADEKQVTLRLSTPPRPDLWRRIPRAQLGSDASAAIVSALLDMLWSERLRPAEEMRDPFCPPGMVCGDSGGAAERRATEQNVLDPWEPDYARFDRDARASGRGESWQRDPEAAAAELQRASGDVQGAASSSPVAVRLWALAALAGGGVHHAGGFVRYEVNALRRYPRFDVGMTFVGARGQPDAGRARRAFAALAQYRFPLDGLEIDVGASFGVFVAERSRSATVRPYLRGLGTFAIDTPSPVAVLIQSELGTTFTSVGSTGAVEYALTLGARYTF